MYARMLTTLIAAALLGACGDLDVPTAQPAAPRLALASDGTGSFTVKAASYGPNGEEVYESGCSSTYAWRTDSTNVSFSSTPWWVYETKNEKVSCVIGSGNTNAGENIVGGEVSVSVSHPDGGYAGGVILADNTETAEFTHVHSNSSIEITAAPWGGYKFLYWTILRADGTSYRDYNANLFRSGSTTDADYFAEFMGT